MTGDCEVEMASRASPTLTDVTSPTLTEVISARAGLTLEQTPVLLSLNEAEEITQLLFEFVGHLGADVGEAGYEYNMVERAKKYGRVVQAGILSAMRSLGTASY